LKEDLDRNKAITVVNPVSLTGLTGPTVFVPKKVEETKSNNK